MEGSKVGRISGQRGKKEKAGAGAGLHSISERHSYPVDVRKTAAGGREEFRVSWFKSEKPRRRTNMTDSTGDEETSKGRMKNLALQRRTMLTQHGKRGRGDSHLQDFDGAF